MTDDQKRELSDIEINLKQMLRLYNKLSSKNQELTDLLAEKERELQAVSNDIDVWKTKYDNLKVARIISVKQDDLSGAKLRLSKLVQEVDKCIALLNE